MTDSIPDVDGSTTETNTSDLDKKTKVSKDIEPSEDLPKGPLGIDPGPLIKDPEKIKELSQIELYYQITRYEILGTAIFFNYNYYKDKPEAHKKAMFEVLHAVTYCEYQTKKFGTDVVGAEENKDFDWGINYFKWYLFHEHFVRELSSEDKDLFERAMKTGENIERFTPKEDWRNYKLTREDKKRFKHRINGQFFGEQPQTP